MPIESTDVEKALANLANADEYKSSGEELDSKEEAGSRNGTDDAAEQYSDSTRGELTESDADAATAIGPKDSELDAVPVPKPRRRKGVTSPAVPAENGQEEAKAEEQVAAKKQRKFASQRHGMATRHGKKGTSQLAQLSAAFCG